MVWEKLGLLFSAADYQLDYAKSPQAIICDEYIRIYFSTCEKDNGKLISSIAYADFDYALEKVLRVSTNVLERGTLGCFDEHGIFPFSPMKDGDRILGYTSGWSRRSSVSVETGIGLTASTDGGKTFHRMGTGPVLTASLHEPFLVVDGFVRHFDDQFHMWYIFGTDWIEFEDESQPDRVYKIGHAVSQDGIAWIKDGNPIIDSIIPYESQALPTVMYHDGRYHMMFCYRHSSDFRNNPKRSYRMGYASSNDLVNWKRDDELAGLSASDTGWDSEMMCYPHWLTIDNHIYLLYNGNHFGKKGFGAARLISGI